MDSIILFCVFPKSLLHCRGLLFFMITYWTDFVWHLSFLQGCFSLWRLQLCSNWEFIVGHEVECESGSAGQGTVSAAVLGLLPGSGSTAGPQAALLRGRVRKRRAFRVGIRPPGLLLLLLLLCTALSFLLCPVPSSVVTQSKKQGGCLASKSKRHR